MYKLLAKQKIKFIFRMLSKNKSTYIILALSIPFLKFLQIMSYDILQVDVTMLVPYGILCFIFINLFGTIPRMRISPEKMIWQVEKAVVWKIKGVVKSCILTLVVAAVIMLCFSMKGQSFQQFIVVMICNVLVNIQTMLVTNYKHRNLSNVLVLIFILICFYTGGVWAAAIGMMLYGIYFVFDSKFDYGIVITFYQRYNKMLYSFLNKDNEAVMQAEDSLFFKSEKEIFPELMKRNIGNRLHFLQAYEIVSICRRWRQILNNYFLVILVTILLSNIQNIYAKMVMLFFLLLLGQSIVAYNINNEIRIVKNGFCFIYSLKEKLICKSWIGMLIMLFPMICYWVVYRIDVFSVLILLCSPIQFILLSCEKKRWKRILYNIPFYILAILAIG